MRFLVIIISFFAINNALSQVPTVVPLEIQAQFNGQFDYKVIGNTHNEFDNWQNPPPPCQMLTQSTAQLNLNPDQNIVAAYLYWSGIGDGTLNPTIQLNGNDIEADVINVVDPQQFGIGLYFGSFADVSDLVIQEGLGTYQFSGLDLNLGSLLSIYCSTSEFYSGWSLLVVYEDNSLPTQQVNIYQGLASVYGNPSEPTSQASITVTNLNVVDTQNARIGFLAWNGSPNLFFNESLSFNGNVLSDALNPINNPFNGTNSYTGATDLWNMDLDVFDISNFIQLGDSQANLIFNSLFSRFIQNVVTVIRSELPDAQVELLAFPGTGDCDVRDFTIETVVSNPESSDVLPANTPISFFVLDSNGDEVFLETFFTQNPIPIDGTETQFLDITIPADIPNDTTLIVKVNTLADGSNPVNENNILNNSFEQELNLLSSPEPIAVQDISQCANLTEANFDLDNALAETPNPEDSISYHLSLNDAENDVNPINTPNNYNPDNLFETIYIRRFNGNCFSTSQFNIETLIPPQITEAAIFAQCDLSEEQNGFDTFDLNAVIPDITGGNTNYEVNFFLTQAEAEDLNITNGLSSPYTNENAFSQILFVRVTDLNNNCVSFTELELQVDLLPVIAEPSNIPTITACDEDENGEEIFNLTANNSTILDGLNPTEHQIQFYTSQTDAENDVNEIENPSTFPSTGQAIFVRVTEIDTSCFSITTFDVIVNPIPPLQDVPTNAVCDTNNDGIAEFFLPLAEDSILTDTNGFSFEYFETLTDAENNTNLIDNPENYINTQTPIQTLYVLATDDVTGCQNIQSITIEVLENPSITEPAIFAQCDLSEEQNGFDTFDLNAVIPEITGGNPNYEVNFFLTQAEAEDLTIVDGLSSPYTNENAFSQILFVRVTDLNNNCVSFTELELQVDLLPVIAESSSIPTIEACDEDENGEEVFDLTANNSTILNGLNPTEHQIQFYTSQTDAENDLNEIDSPSAFPSTGQEIFVRVTDNETGCFSITTFDVIVNSIPPLQAVPTNAVCDTNNDGIAEFFLPLAEDSILTDTTGFSFEYFETLTDAENNTNSIPNPDNYQNIQTPIQTLYVLATDDVTGCQNIQSIQIEVLENPSITEPVVFAQCDLSEEQNGFDTFDLNAVIPEITGGNSNYEVNFFLTQAEAENLNITNGLSSPYTNENAFSQILFVRVTDLNNNCVSFTELELQVDLLPVIAESSSIPVIESCDEDEDSQELFDLTSNNTVILNGLNPTEHQIQFYTSQTDAENDVNEIDSPTVYPSTVQTIFVRVTDNQTGCFSITNFDVIVNPIPPLQDVPTNAVCDTNNDGIAEFFLPLAEDSILTDTNGFSFEYFETLTDAENNTNLIDNPENYINTQTPIQTLYVLATDDVTGCQNIQSITIEVLENPSITEPAIFARCDFSEEQNGFDTFDLNAVIPEITGGNPNYEVNFFLTQAEAEDLNITNGLSSPYTNENAFSQILFVRVTDLNNNCVSFTELELQVDLLPVIAESSSIPVIESCDEDDNGEDFFDLTANNPTILNGLNPTEHQIQFFTSQTDAENDVNEIDSPSIFPSTGQSIFVRVTDNQTGCFSITTFDVIVNPIPPLQAVPTNAVCDTNNDGIAEFFLPLAEDSILTDTSGFSFEYFETLTDAENNTNPIPNPDNFQNTQTPIQTLYVLATNDVTGCQNIQSITIEIVPVSFIPFDLTDLGKCEASLDDLNIEMDLTEQAPFIFGSSDPSDYTTTYHLSQSEAASGQNPIPNPETFLSISNPQEIWVRLVNNASNCVEIGSFNYEILLAPVITPPENIPPIEQCADDDNDAVQTWDLNSTIPSFYDTPELADISFYLTQSDAENAVNALPENFQNTENPQSIFVRVEANENACVEFTNFDLLVNTVNDTLIPTNLERCDTNNDGFVEDFDFQNIIDDYANNFPEISLSFHISFSDASTQSNPLSSPYQNEVENEQTIYVYAFDNSTNCGQIFELLLRSVPIPELNNPDQLRVCDSDEDGIANFDLTLIEDETLGDLEQDNLLISYHTSLSDAESDLNPIPDPGNFENTELPQTIWIRVTDSSNLNNCFGITSFELGIDFLPVANQPEDLFLCDADNDGIETFDVSLQNETVLNGLPDTENTISYHKTLSDAENNLNPIEENYTNENNPQSIYVRLENNNAPECFTTTVFDIEALETPVIDIENEIVLCENEPILVSINENFDEYLWSTGETSSSISITEPGNYEVTTFINYPELSCEATKSFEVFASNQATISDITVVDWSQNDNSITILVEGSGGYEYSIDGINYQDSNVFNNLIEYEYLVHIRDKNGCGETLRRVYLLDYPQFFTPNGDGINDRWQIINSAQEIFTKIYIFDRYGKLVADINPAGSGWDGSFNGNALPSNDYWFRVEREDGRVFTGHFTLKR